MQQETIEPAPLAASSSAIDDDIVWRDGGDGSTVEVKNHSFFHPAGRPFRYFGLIFICFLSFGNYFVYDTAGALQSDILRDMDVNVFQFQSLYYVYNWPNAVLCLVGGFLIDRVLGVAWGAIIFAIFVTAGHMVYGLGAYLGHFWLMLVGRFIFAIGGENLAVANNNYAVNWFLGKELNFVFGLQLSTSRLGATANFYSMSWVYNKVAESMEVKEGYEVLGITLMIGGLTCVLSLIVAFVLWFLNRKRNAALPASTTAHQESDLIQLRDVKSFPLSFWLLCLICVSFYSAVFPFISMSEVYFMNKFELSKGEANHISGLPYIISAAVSPFCGLLVDRVGRNIMFVLVACIVTLLVHVIMAFSFINPYVPMVIMGVSYSVLAASLWPIVALILPQNQLGTGYGIMQSIQNAGLGGLAMLTGYVVDAQGYLLLEVVNIACLSVAVSSTAVILLTDTVQTGGYLSMASSMRPMVSPGVAQMEEKQRIERLKHDLGQEDVLTLDDEAKLKVEPKGILSRGASVQRRKSTVLFADLIKIEGESPVTNSRFKEIFGGEGKITELVDSSKEGSVVSVFESGQSAGKDNQAYEEEKADDSKDQETKDQETKDQTSIL